MAEIKCRILYFAGVKDITKKESEELAFAEDEKVTLAALSQILIDKYGAALQDQLSASLYAVNMEYVEKDRESETVISPHAEIAIIPPVSGG